jgi:drug/metabolite transporter (DMT)-like permease
MVAEVPGWLWAACAVGAAAVQTARNAMQRNLTQRLGTVGATHVRFLFGLPFGLLFLAGMALAVDLAALRPSPAFLGWTVLGGGAQILATALMLAAMRERSFVVATAYLKTEPVQIALFGMVFLGERLGVQASAAVLLATAGVVLMSMPVAAAGTPGASPGSAGAGSPGASGAPSGALQRLLPRAALLGVAAGGMFALSAVGFRGAILALGDGPFFARATVTLAASLALQTAALSAWLLWRDRRVLVAIFRLWRPSLLAGAAGACASQLWFLAFSLQAAAAVRTVGLVEILFAQAVSHRLFSQATTRREAIGMAAMVAGVLWLLLAQR